MELTNLKRLRKVVPGSIFLFFSIPAYQYLSNDLFSLDSAATFTIKGYGSVLAFVIGTFFSNTKIRALKTKKAAKEIDDNIKSRLLDEGLAGAPTQDAQKIESIKSSRQLMDIFYHFVDKDPSLKEKAHLVRDNGLFWTSTADLAILGCLFSWVYLIMILVCGPQLLLVSAGLLIGALGFISGEFLYPNTVKEHIRLSDAQIGYILTINRAELQTKVTGLFN